MPTRSPLLGEQSSVLVASGHLHHVQALQADELDARRVVALDGVAVPELPVAVLPEREHLALDTVISAGRRRRRELEWEAGIHLS